MSKDLKDEMKSMAEEIREQATQLRYVTFLSFIYTADVVNRYLDMELSGYPVGRTGFSILHFLVLHGGAMTPTELSKRVFRSKHAVTRMVDTLEKLGFVKRGPIGKDRRMRKVVITREGLEFTKRSFAAGEQRIGDKLFSSLDQKKMEDLRAILRQVRMHVLDLIADYKNK